jgi:hypothetical protein
MAPSFLAKQIPSFLNFYDPCGSIQPRERQDENSMGKLAIREIGEIAPEGV